MADFDAERVNRLLEEIDALRFDETGPFETGFGAVFEREIKPHWSDRLLAWHEGEYQKMRKQRIAWPIVGVTLAAMIAAAAYAVRIDSELLLSPISQAAFLTLGLLDTALLTWALTGGHDLESARFSFMHAVAARFGLAFTKDKNLQDDRFLTAMLLNLPSSAHAPDVSMSPKDVPKLFATIKASPLSGKDVHFGSLSGPFRGTTPFRARFVELRDSNNMNRTTFRGWILMLELPKPIVGEIDILERKTAPARIWSGLQEVALESSEFHDRFRVYASDQVEARTVLTPDVMVDLMSAVGGLGSHGGLNVQIKGAKAMFTIPSDDSPFRSLDLFDPPGTMAKLHCAFAELATLRKLLEDVDVIYRKA